MNCRIDLVGPYTCRRKAVRVRITSADREVALCGRHDAKHGIAIGRLKTTERVVTAGVVRPGECVITEAFKP